MYEERRVDQNFHLALTPAESVLASLAGLQEAGGRCEDKVPDKKKPGRSRASFSRGREEQPMYRSRLRQCTAQK